VSCCKFGPEQLQTKEEHVPGTNERGRLRLGFRVKAGFQAQKKSFGASSHLTSLYMPSSVPKSAQYCTPRSSNTAGSSTGVQQYRSTAVQVSREGSCRLLAYYSLTAAVA
jgi:hypothetical protein